MVHNQRTVTQSRQIGDHRRRHKSHTATRRCAIGTVQLGGVGVPVSGQVRTLGVTIGTMSFDRLIDNICKASFCHIRALRRIRKLITSADMKTVATAVVSSRLDYCNSLLYDISAGNIKKLQRVQNTLARLVTGSSMRCHITPILADLHWLPVSERIEYKVALLTFKTLTTHRPTYLYELLKLHRPVKQLRSSNHCSLHDEGFQSAFGGRAFCHAAPSVWNSLPHSLTDNYCTTSFTAFKRQLKTHLYSKSFIQ